jgi:hypothetical protein
MTARLTRLLAFAALALAACAAPSGPSASDALVTRISRITVAPLNLAVRAPAALAGKGEPVWHELLLHFQTRDKQVAVLSPQSAEWLWVEATLDLDASDRRRALRAARSRFARGLAEHRAYDLLVVPSLVLRPARMHGAYASWDGVQRVVPKDSVATDPGIEDVFHPPGSAWVGGLQGKVAAASLHVAVLRPDGTPVHEGFGGLDVVQEVHRDDPWGGRWTFEVRPEPFADPEHLREGVERAFEGTFRRTPPPLVSARVSARRGWTADAEPRPRALHMSVVITGDLFFR